MKLSRLIGISYMIESKQHIRAKELADFFEVSVRTIYRDVETLCEAGIPIYASTGPNGGFSFVEGYSFNSNALDKNEMEKLIMSVYQQAIKETDHGSKDSLMLKMKKIIPKNEQERFERLLDKTKSDASSWWGAKQIPMQSESSLDLIQRSIYKLKKIRFDYQSNAEFMPNRVLRPYGIVHKGDAWYAVGYSEERNDLRTFHCDRMSNVTICEEDYTIPGDFDLGVYWERSTREFLRRSGFNARTEHTASPSQDQASTLKYPVSLLSETDIGRTLAGFAIIKNETSSSGYHYIVDLISERTALNFLMLQLGEIKILEPFDLREKVIQLAEKIMKRQNA